MQVLLFPHLLVIIKGLYHKDDDLQNGYSYASFKKILRQNFSWILSLKKKTSLLFISKPTERP